MKISCLKNDLLIGINIAMRAVPAKTTLQILESFLIDAREDIRIITNDKDMGIETIIEGAVQERGKIAIDARIFGEIVRKLPDNEVIIEANDNYKVKIRCEDSEFTLNGRDPEEFPELPAINEENKVSMSQFTLKELIRQTIFSISMTDTNIMMKGELFEVNGDTIKVVSLDSHRISIRKEKLNGIFGNFKVIVPGKTLNEISRILEGDKESFVEMSFDRNFVKFKFSKTEVISRLIDGEFFDVEQMISSDYETQVTVNKNLLLNSIDRAFTLTREGEKKPIVLNISADNMNVDINTSLGSMNSHFPIAKMGKDICIGFNPKFFIDVLKVISGDDVDIFFVNSNAPCFIRDSEGSYIYIILPVKLKDEY